jgi:hypothetical protein
MIVVQKRRGAWYWYACSKWSGFAYDTADHALRDAWTWVGGNVPALIYTWGL